MTARVRGCRPRPGREGRRRNAPRFVIGEHDDDCAGQDCSGCLPCRAAHCVVCARSHATAATPVTCTECVSKIREDLDRVADLAPRLRDEAVSGARDGRLAAAAPIPGGAAMVLIGPGVPVDDVHMSREYPEIHLPRDVQNPSTVLRGWAARWAEWFGHARPLGVTASADYLDTHLTTITQATSGGTRAGDPPSVSGFSYDISRLRVAVERVLHDEDAPERGVECFDCGEQLVRRFADPTPCRHDTPARVWLRTLIGYGLPVWTVEVRAARVPCGRCTQGGIVDPSPGLSWECPACRRSYTPGEYARAVRSELMDRSEVDAGWSDVGMAADAAATLVGHAVSAKTVRVWADRGNVASMCVWTPGRCWGRRLVFWPDVAERAARIGGRHRRGIV